MDNQNDVALVNTINERGIRVEEANAGAFVGSNLVAGKEFDWSKLYSNLSYVAPNYTGFNFLLVIANLSSYNINLHRLTEDAVPSDTTVEVGKIDWFSIGYWENDAAMAMHNYSVEGIEGNPALRYVRFFAIDMIEIMIIILMLLMELLMILIILNKIINLCLMKLYNMQM